MRYLYFSGIVSLSLLTVSCARQQSTDVEVMDQTFIHKYGVAVPPNFWDASGKDGSVISTMADGVVITRTYSAGLLNGETTYSFPHSSQIQKKELYNNGTITKELEFHFDGTPQREVAYDCPIGMKTVSTWYLSGIPKSIEQYSGNLLYNGEYFTSTNQRDACVENYAGNRLVRDDHGQLISTDTVHEGQLVSRITYHPNSMPKESIPYCDNLIHGTKRTYHPAGEPASVEEWKGGKQEGLTMLYLHGEKYAEVPYANGVKHGVEQRYRDGSDLAQELSWSDGRLHGPSTSYINDNQRVEWYYQGAPTTEADYNFMISRPPVRN